MVTSLLPEIDSFICDMAFSMIVCCSLKYRKQSVNITAPIHRLQIMMQYDAFLTSKPANNAEINVKAKMDHKIPAKRNLIFRLANSFIITPQSAVFHLYPMPRTVIILSGAPGLSSIFVRSLRMYTVRELLSIYCSLQSHNLLNIWSGESIWSGCSMNRHNNLYSLAVRSSRFPFLYTVPFRS